MIVNGILMDYVTTLGGFAIFVFMYRLFKVRTPKKLLCGISTLSYELYLIHHHFALVKSLSLIYFQHLTIGL